MCFHVRFLKGLSVPFTEKNSTKNNIITDRVFINLSNTMSGEIFKHFLELFAYAYFVNLVVVQFK